MAHKVKNGTLRLDSKGNIPIEALRNARGLSQQMAKLVPVRDLDWRNVKGRRIRTLSQKHIGSLHGQRCGVVVPVGDTCGQCTRGNGPFESCVLVILMEEPFLLGKGACMNCYFGGHRMPGCTLREEASMLGPKSFVAKYVDTGSFNIWVARYNRVNRPGAKSVGVANLAIESGINYMESKKRKRALEYDRTYYQSPLERSDMTENGGFSKKRQALESIHSVYDRVLQDINRLFTMLKEADELESHGFVEEMSEDATLAGPVDLTGSSVKVEDDEKDPAIQFGVKEEQQDKKDILPLELKVKKEEDEQKYRTPSPKPRIKREEGKQPAAPANM